MRLGHSDEILNLGVVHVRIFSMIDLLSKYNKCLTCKLCMNAASHKMKYEDAFEPTVVNFAVFKVCLKLRQQTSSCTRFERPTAIASIVSLGIFDTFPLAKSLNSIWLFDLLGCESVIRFSPGKGKLGSLRKAAMTLQPDVRALKGQCRNTKNELQLMTRFNVAEGEINRFEIIQLKTFAHPNSFPWIGESEIGHGKNGDVTPKGEAAMPMAARRTVKSAKSFRMFRISADMMTDCTLHCFPDIWLIGNMLWWSFDEYWRRKKQYFHTTWGARGCMEHVQAVTVLGISSAATSNDCTSEVFKSSIVQVQKDDSLYTTKCRPVRMHVQSVASGKQVPSRFQAGSKQVVED